MPAVRYCKFGDAGVSGAQGVQSVLLSAVATHGSAKPYENSAYLARLKAHAAEQALTAARRRLAALEDQLATLPAAP